MRAPAGRQAGHSGYVSEVGEGISVALRDGGGYPLAAVSARAQRKGNGGRVASLQAGPAARTSASRDGREGAVLDGVRGERERIGLRQLADITGVDRANLRAAYASRRKVGLGCWQHAPHCPLTVPHESQKPFGICAA